MLQADSAKVSKDHARAWEALTPPLSEWLLDAISSKGFNRMTPVQASTIPLFMTHKDVVVEVQLFPWARHRQGLMTICRQ